MRETLLRTARGVRWYVREATGEAKWDQYLDQCRAQGVESMSRREYERHRVDHREANPQSRCC